MSMNSPTTSCFGTLMQNMLESIVSEEEPIPQICSTIEESFWKHTSDKKGCIIASSILQPRAMDSKIIMVRYFHTSADTLDAALRAACAALVTSLPGLSSSIRIRFGITGDLALMTCEMQRSLPLVLILSKKAPGAVMFSKYMGSLKFCCLEVKRMSSAITTRWISFCRICSPRSRGNYSDTKGSVEASLPLLG